MNTYEKLKDVGLRLFAEQGYGETALSQIAKEVGIKTPGIYAHFTSKDDLFLEIYKDVISEQALHVKQLGEGQKNKDVQTLLHELFTQEVSYYAENKRKIHFIQRTMITPPTHLKEQVEELFYDSEDIFTTILQQLFEQGKKEGVLSNIQTEALQVTFLCLLDGLFTQMLFGGRMALDEKAENVWQIYWSGISKKN